MTLLVRSCTFLTVALLLLAPGCASTSSHESTGEYVDDAAITTRVKTAIFDEPGLKVLQINVATTKRVVQLSGFVKTRADMNKAVDVASGIQGVRSVDNDLKLKSE